MLSIGIDPGVISGAVVGLDGDCVEWWVAYQRAKGGYRCFVGDISGCIQHDGLNFSQVLMEVHSVVEQESATYVQITLEGLYAGKNPQSAIPLAESAGSLRAAVELGLPRCATRRPIIRTYATQWRAETLSLSPRTTAKKAEEYAIVQAVSVFLWDGGCPLKAKKNESGAEKLPTKVLSGALAEAAFIALYGARHAGR